MRSKPRRWKLLLISSIAGGVVPTTLFLLKVYQIISEHTQYLVMAAGSLVMSGVCAVYTAAHWQRADRRWISLAASSGFATFGVGALIGLTGDGTFENTVRDRSLQVSAIVLFFTTIILWGAALVASAGQTDEQAHESTGADKH
jgi:hypothetical protein